MRHWKSKVCSWFYVFCLETLTGRSFSGWKMTITSLSTCHMQDDKKETSCTHRSLLNPCPVKWDGFFSIDTNSSWSSWKRHFTFFFVITKIMVLQNYPWLTVFMSFVFWKHWIVKWWNMAAFIWILVKKK